MITDAELLTARDVMNITQLSRTSVYQILRSGLIPTVRIGRRVLVRRETLTRWIAEHEDDPLDDETTR